MTPEELRAIATGLETSSWHSVSFGLIDQVRKAADEIERLQKRLATALGDAAEDEHLCRASAAKVLGQWVYGNSTYVPMPSDIVEKLVGIVGKLVERVAELERDAKRWKHLVEFSELEGLGWLLEPAIDEVISKDDE